MTAHAAAASLSASMSRRTAAALLITRGDGRSLEVFLGERAPELRFFGGYWALPGGTVGDEDRVHADEAAALVACAHRELFEETGLLRHTLPATRTSGDSLRDLRQQLLTAEQRGRAGTPTPSPWPSLIAGAAPPPPLRELCRIETPPFAPVRYDTVFFHVPLESCTAGTLGPRPDVWPGELVQGRWWLPQQALASWRNGDLMLVPPVVILLEHLAAAEAFEDFAERIAVTTNEYHHGRLHQVRFSPGVVMAPLLTPTLPPATTTNCYVVGHRQLWVVDPGSPHPDEQLRLVRLLEELTRSGATVEGMLVTHHHIDHVGGVNALSRALNLPVRGHPLTLSRLEPGFRAGAALDDGMRVPLGTAPDGSPGWELLALHTPGHDRGHLCFRESRYGTMLVGDMLSTVSTIIVDPPEGHLATYLHSLERLAQSPMTTLYPAHGPAMRDGQKLVTKYLRHRRQRETALLAALQATGRTVEELLPKVYWDADPKLYPFAARSLLAGLQKLQEEGRAVDIAGRWSLANG
jgi:glyoxylase-like metal-dependent hydrolase (beta-lactamase superfamily II)/8-oxo-dGTP pyrophosphatase MutT (NUDIX family)